MRTPRKPYALFDEVIKQYKLRSDTHFAEEIGYTKGRVCEVRAGTAVLTDEMRCAIARRFNMSLKKIDELAPPAKQKGSAK